MGVQLALEPGTWADWANAAATTLAFAIALVLLVIGLRDRRRAAEDRLRDQARRVWIWSTHRSSKEVEPGEVRPERAGYIIRNSSEDPITDCFVQLVPMHLFGDPVSAWGDVWGGARPDVAVIDAGASFQGSLPYDGRVMPDSAEPSDVQVFFTDAAGVRWTRTSSGHLKLIRLPGNTVRSRGAVRLILHRLTRS